MNSEITTGTGNGRTEMVATVTESHNSYNDRTGEQVRILILWESLKMFWDGWRLM